MNIVHKYPSPLDCFLFFLCQVYLLTSDLFVDSVSSSVIWLNVRCWGSGGTVRGGRWEA